MKRVWLAFAVALCASLAVNDVEAAAAKRVRADALVLRGCTHYVPPVRAGITSRGATYSLFSAGPPLPLGVGVDVYGRVEGVSPCLASVNVVVTSWRRNRLHC